MESRAAVLWGIGEPWKVEDITIDDPGPNEVLVKTKAAGMCHSDEHAVTNVRPAEPDVGHPVTNVRAVIGAFRPCPTTVRDETDVFDRPRTNVRSRWGVRVRFVTNVRHEGGVVGRRMNVRSGRPWAYRRICAPLLFAFMPWMALASC